MNMFFATPDSIQKDLSISFRARKIIDAFNKFTFSSIKEANQFLADMNLNQQEYFSHFIVHQKQNNRVRSSEHEKYYNIKRVEIARGDLIVHNLIFSLSKVVADAGQQTCNLPDMLFEYVFKSVKNFFHYIVNNDIEISTINIEIDSAHLKSEYTLPDISCPLQRWLIGHYLFFSLIQAIIWNIVNLQYAILKNDVKKAKYLLVCLANTFYASIVGFKFGTHYLPRLYEEQVRPSMGPPDFTPGFSDINSVDHRYMLQMLKKLRTLGIRYYEDTKEYQYFKTAINAVYEQHSLVCQSAVGKKQSLLDSTHAQNKKKLAAYETIRTVYKKRTLNLLEE